jgi:hypothetical protein
MDLGAAHFFSLACLFLRRRLALDFIFFFCLPFWAWVHQMVYVDVGLSGGRMRRALYRVSLLLHERKRAR